MNANDIPESITKAVYQVESVAISQNQFAELLAAAWPKIVEFVHTRACCDPEGQ